MDARREFNMILGQSDQFTLVGFVVWKKKQTKQFNLNLFVIKIMLNPRHMQNLRKESNNKGKTEVIFVTSALDGLWKSVISATETLAI